MNMSQELATWLMCFYFFVALFTGLGCVWMWFTRDRPDSNIFKGYPQVECKCKTTRWCEINDKCMKDKL